MVPEGYTVTIEFRNDDPVMTHNLGTLPELANFATPPLPRLSSQVPSRRTRSR